MTFDWPYYTIRNGKLYDEDGRQAFATPSYDVPAAPLFAGEYAVMAAEDWLHTYDQRGNVRS